LRWHALLYRHALLHRHPLLHRHALRRIASQRLRRIHPRRQILMLLQPLRHPLQGIGRHLTHLLKVGLLLCALIGS